MKRYDKYKPSGIDWIGEVPEMWKIERLKFLFSHSNAGVWGDDEKGNKDDIVCFRVADFNYEKGCLFLEDNTIRNIDEKSLKGRLIKQNDLLIEKSGGGDNAPVGRVVKVNTDIRATCSNFIHFLTVDKYNDAAFLFYYFKFLYANKINLLFFNQTTGIQNLKLPAYLGQMAFMPSLPEQTAIAAYLDAKCSKIDNVVAIQQKRIELLKELKQSIITRAVTKGLNKNVKMKDSGVEWIGKVPEDWVVKKTLYCLTMPLTDGPHETPALYEDGIPFISAEAVSNGTIDFEQKRGYISKQYYDECCKKYIPQKEDIYMIKSGATTGRCAIVETDEIFTIWSPLAVFRADKNTILPYYLLYILRSEYYQNQVEISWSYGTQQNIGMRDLEKLKIAVPLPEEQTAIVAYLDKKCAAIDSQIAKVEKQIELLNEYKQSIITECVTGKRKVC